MAQPPSLIPGPEPVETADLHFKLCCKLKAFDSDTKYESGNCSAIAISQYYGLCFFQSLNGFSVVKTKSINPMLDFIAYPKRDIILNFKATHISVDFTQKILAVVCQTNAGSVLLFYNIASFSQKDVVPIQTTPLSKVAQTSVLQLQWQPNADSKLMICLSDGSVLSISLANKDGALCNLPATAQATCLCWSPKGKQVVIGSATGTISQYKPDLKLVKTLPAPPLFNEAVTVVSVLWISNFQFAVAYNDKNNQDLFPVITIVNAAKNEPVNVINYDDITFSSILFRHHQIYMYHQSTWNLIFVSSANSIEVAVLHSKDGSNWEQWLLGDASRAELPLNANREETFPLGFAFDYTSQETIPWGEGTLPAMPRLWLFSDEGVLCIFNVVYSIENAPQLCAPPSENIDDSVFTTKEVTATSTLAPAPSVSIPAVSEAAKNVQVSKSFTMQPGLAAPTFGSGKPSYSFVSTSGFGAFTSQTQNLTSQVTITPISGGSVFGANKDTSQIPKVQVPTQPSQQISVVQPQTTGFSASPKFSMPAPLSGVTAAPVVAFKMNPPSTQTVPPVVKFDTQQGNLFQTKPLTQVNVFAGKNLPQSTPIKQPELEKPATPVQVKTTPVPKKPEETTETKETGKGKSPSGSPAPETPPPPVIDDSVYLNAVRDEIEHFNSELQQLSAKVGSLNARVGTEEEKLKMKKSIGDLYEFWKELKETTVSQNGEIHAIVMDLMESFAWLEDAKSRNAQRKNPSYIELKRSAELDPISTRHMTDIANLKYYIENQLKQLSAYLEKEWMDHQESYRMEVKNRMTVPPLEEVYKTMHYQLKILNKHRLLVEELKEKMTSRKQKNKTQSSLIMESSPIASNTGGNRVSELSKLADNLLQLKVCNDDTKPKIENVELMKSQLKAIAERSKKLTAEKQATLRDILSERDTVKIRPTKTNLESSSFVRSLLIQKSMAKASKTESKSLEPKENEKVSPLPTKTENTFSFKSEKVITAKPETSKSIFTFGGGPPVEKPMIPLTVSPFPPKTEEKSPLSMLSGVVSKIGKENGTKSKPSATTFVFGSSSFQKPETNKENVFSVKANPKLEESKPAQTFTFRIPKPTSFGKLDPPKFGFGNSSISVSSVSTTANQAVPITMTPNVSISAVSSTTTATTTSSPFTFSFSSLTTTAPSTLPKGNALFAGKDQSTGFGGTSTVGSIFSSSVVSTQNSTPIFGSSAPVFGSGKLTFETSTTSIFGVPKTTTETTPQSTGFTFTQVTEPKATPTTEVSVMKTINKSSQEEEIDVVKVEETSKKAESVQENTVAKTTVAKATVAPAVSSSTEPTKTVAESTTSLSAASLSLSSAPPNVQVVSTAQITSVTPTTASIVTKTTVETSTTSSMSSQPTTTTSSVFSFSTSSPIAFVQTATTTAVTTTSSGFGQTPSTTASIFGQVSSATPTTNIFVGGTPTTPTSNIFGGSVQSSKPIFGQTSTPTTTTGSIFGVSTPTSNAFGQATTPTSSQSAFGQATTPTSSQSAFGQATTPTSSQSAFGQATTPTSSQSAFGQATTPTSSQSAFGQAATPTSSQSVFGQATTPFSSQSAFGQATTPTSSQSAFGQATTPTSSQSAFGQATTPTSSQSAFGQATTPTSTSSAFGQATTPTSTSSAFGQATTPTSSSSTFGQKSDSVAQTLNIFGQLLTTDENRSGNMFGNTGTPATTANIFSTPKNIFGGPSTTTSLFRSSSSSIFPQTTSVFGQPTTTTTSNIFGQAQTPTSNSFFGQTICSPFGGGTSVSSNQSTFESGSFNSKPIFGQSLFRQTTNNTSIFGGSPNTSVFGNSSTSPSSGNVFQAATTSTTFGSTSPGPFSSGQGSVSQTGFRADTSSFQKPLGGFGSAPVFGRAPTATPAFGATPAFSSTTSFGSLPTFGSRPGVFDSSQGMFARPTGQSTTFENLANQNTVGFGNLAQQSQSQGFGGVSGFGSSGFENKPAFGGSSFSGWRSK